MNTRSQAFSVRYLTYGGCVPECVAKWLGRVIQKVSWDIGAKIAFFLATGTLRSRSGLDLQQAGGFTVVAEKLNWYRYISHFRSVHRGAFFAELKTTSVRKLLPEAWGELVTVSSRILRTVLFNMGRL